MIMAGCLRFRHAKIATAGASNFSDRFRIAEHAAPLRAVVLSDSSVWRDGRQLDSPIAETADAESLGTVFIHVPIPASRSRMYVVPQEPLIIVVLAGQIEVSVRDVAV